MVVAATAAVQKGGKFPYPWDGSEVYSFLLNHHFSSPKSQARNVCKLQCLDLLQKENIFTMKGQGNILVPAIWMSVLEAKVLVASTRSYKKKSAVIVHDQ